MSLSNPRSSSPVSKWFRLRASTGDVVYYDKSLQKEVVVPLPFKFVVLDVLNTIGGYHESSQSGIRANEVRTNQEVLTVRSRAGTLAEGSYEQIKDRIKTLGGKFANSVYIAYEEGGELVLGNLNLIGASVSAWFDFKQGKSLDVDPGVVITSFTAAKKGATEYFVPTFDRYTVDDAELSVAASLDRDLQEYLSNRGRKVEEVEEPAVQESFFTPSPTLTAAAPF